MTFFRIRVKKKIKSSTIVGSKKKITFVLLNHRRMAYVWSVYAWNMVHHYRISHCNTTTLWAMCHNCKERFQNMKNGLDYYLVKKVAYFNPWGMTWLRVSSAFHIMFINTTW